MLKLNTFFAILMFSIILWSCKKEVQPTLSDDKLVAILTDLHLAEASFMTLNQNVKDSIYKVYYQQIFEIHEVTDSTFFKDFELLRRNPKKLEKVYKNVIEEIEQIDVKKKEDNTPKKNKQSLQG